MLKAKRLGRSKWRLRRFDLSTPSERSFHRFLPTVIQQIPFIMSAFPGFPDFLIKSYPFGVIRGVDGAARRPYHKK